jgi:hypothetical protein
VKRLTFLLALLVACDEDKPDSAEVARAMDDCKQLLKHIVTISPQGAGKSPDEVVAALPIEDLQACAATDPAIRQCMAKASDVAAVKSCPGQIACASTAMAARDKARKEHNQPAGSPALDKPFDDIRAKCLAGDEHAADSLRTE